MSKVYTNHCIHATVVTTLDDKGFEARDIMATTRHKSEASIRSYSKCQPKKRRKISDALATTLHGKNDQNQAKVTESEKAEVPTTPQSNIMSMTSEHQSIDIPPVLDLFPDFKADDDIPDEQILDVLTQIEQENSNMLLPVDKQPKNSKTINIKSVSNVATVNRHPMMPAMYFPNSNVMINYNFHK